MPDLDGAVIDAPLLDDVQDQHVDDEIIDDDLGDGAGGGDGDAAAAAAAAAGGEVRQDERKLPQWIKDLKGVNQAAFKEAKGQFFGKLAIDDKLKDFDLDGTKSFLEEHGGREALATALGDMRQAQTELEQINQAVAAGDRTLVEQMATSSPEGFAKLAPAVAEKWAQVDPEGWDHAMSGVFNATIQQSGVPMHLDRMGLQMEQMKYVLESNPQLMQNPALVAVYNQLSQQIQTLKGWTGSFAEKAGKALQRQAQPGAGKVDARVQELDQREANLFTQDLNRDVTNFRDPLITKELGSYIARRPEDKEAASLAIDTVRSKVIEKMSADSKFQKDLNGLCARKDKTGAMRLIQSRETAAIQEIAPKVGRTIFGNPGAAKKNADAATAGGRQQQQQQQRRQPQRDIDPRDAILRRALAR
jgi:hypothetical protein